MNHYSPDTLTLGVFSVFSVVSFLNFKSTTSQPHRNICTLAGNAKFGGVNGMTVVNNGKDLSENRIVAFMATTDRGPNEVWARKAIQVQVREREDFLYLPSDCFEHQCHLAVLGGLALCDTMLKQHRGWKYFSSVAIICNTLRDLSPSLFSSWREIFGDVSAVATVKSLFPRCIAERWGSVDASEARLLKAGLDRVCQAFAHLVTAAPDLLAENDKPLPETAVDNISLEEKKAFSIKMGKWRKHTFDVLHDPLFSKVCEVMHLTRKPIIHLSNYLKAKLGDGMPEGHLCRLVCGKAQSIYEAYDDLLFCSCANN